MLDAEHVTCFVRQNFATAAQHDSGTIRIIFVAETWIIAGKAINSDPISEQRFSKHKVPTGLGIEIGKGDSQQTVGVTGVGAA